MQPGSSLQWDTVRCVMEGRTPVSPRDGVMITQRRRLRLMLRSEATSQSNKKSPYRSGNPLVGTDLRAVRALRIQHVTAAPSEKSPYQKTGTAVGLSILRQLRNVHDGPGVPETDECLF